MKICLEIRQTGHCLNKSQIDIAQIMIYRSSSRKSTGNMNLLQFRPLPVHFRLYTLMFAHHHRRRILPKHKNIISSLLQQIFFCRQMEVNIGERTMNTTNHNVYSLFFQKNYL